MREWVHEVVACERQLQARSGVNGEEHNPDVIVPGTLVVTSERVLFVPMTMDVDKADVVSLPLLGIASVHVEDAANGVQVKGYFQEVGTRNCTIL